MQFDIPQSGAGRSLPQAVSVSSHEESEEEVVTEDEMRHRERTNTVAALRKSNWKIYGSGGAAVILGIKPTTLVARIKKMGIQKEKH